VKGPPPLPVCRTTTLSISRAGDKLVVTKLGAPDPLAWLIRQSRTMYEALYLNAARIVSSAVIEVAHGHVVELTGAFYAESGVEEDPTKRWIGPLPIAECTSVAAAIDRALGLPLVPVRVDAAMLRARAAELGGELIEITDVWDTRGAETSSFAGCWLTAPRYPSFERATYTVIGFYRQSKREPGYPPPLGGDAAGGSIDAVTIIAAG